MDAPIGNYMTEQPHSVGPKQTLQFALDMMKKYNIRHLPVLAGSRVVGIVSDRDFSLVDLYPDMSLEKSLIEDLMMQDVYQVSPSTPLKEVVANMAEKKLGATIICEGGDKLAGIFTAIDGLKLLEKLYDR